MTWLIKMLWRQAYVFGTFPSLLCAIAWLVGGGFAIRLGIEQLWRYEHLAMAYILFVGLIVSFGVLVSIWILADHLEFHYRGYRIQWLVRDEWVYEERCSDGKVERLPFSRKAVGEGYPAPCHVYIHNERNWDLEVPQWAWGRRIQIAERIAECSGANVGGHVEFIDPV